ncbi:MAG TPA: ornithine carbamoyltransferase [Candidatus Bathyarchaeia archaeon]|nr:ornithine carbamoyltransferase [Candidatus Bathyarchaeia archaeon]
MLTGRDFLSMTDLSREELQSILDVAIKLKAESKSSGNSPLLSKKVVGLLFEKPSTRTRVGFETAVYQLGGQAMYLRSDELQLSRGEPLKDTARILGSYLSGIVIRTYAHQNLVEFAKYAPVPIINALSDLEHPTQIVADMMTILEAKGKLSDLRFVFVGDGNNVCNSWLLGGAIMGMEVTVTCPKACQPEKLIIDKAERLAKQSGGKIEFIQDPAEAVEGADVLYTDVWVSMGQEKSAKVKAKKFKAYQLNSKLVAKTRDDCSIMHCLPAKRGEEITDEIIESPRSIVWQQAENKMHGARAVLAAFLS